MRRRIFAVALSLAAIAAACSPGSRSERTMELKVVEGAVRLIRGDSSSLVRSNSQVAVGDRILVDPGGIAELRLASGRLFELWEAEVEIVEDTRLTLRRGNLLADLEGPGTVDAENVTVSSRNAAFRVDRALSTRVGVYEGNVVLTRPGRSLALPRLRQAIVAGGILPRSEKPLSITYTDRWDRRFLQEAIDLDIRLQNFGRGLESQLGARSGLEFFTAVMPGTDVTFLLPHGASRRSDVLIGMAIALEAVVDPLRLQSLFDGVFGLWNDGASWGLIAYERGVTQIGLFARLLDMVRLAGLAPAGSGTGVSGVPGSTGGGGGSQPPQGGGSSPSPAPSPTESPTPDPSPTYTGVDLVDDTINTVIDQLP